MKFRTWLIFSLTLLQFPIFALDVDDELERMRKEIEQEGNKIIVEDRSRQKKTMHLPYSGSPNIENLQSLMRENKLNFEFIDIVLSNLSPAMSENEKITDYQNGKPRDETLKKRNRENNPYYRKLLLADRIDLEGIMMYYRSEYNKSYKYLKYAQKLLKDLYEDTLDMHNEQSRVLISYISRRILKSDDANSKYLVRLAFRELKIAENHFTLGFNTVPYQFRDKIVNYEMGFQASRRARRFAILALISYKTPDEDKPAYQKQSLSELQNSVNEGKVNDYEYIKATLRNFIENKLLEPKIAMKVAFPKPDPYREEADAYTYDVTKDSPLELMEMHDDNYGIITYNRFSLLDDANTVIRRDAPGPIIPEKDMKPATPTPASKDAKDIAPTPPAKK